MGERLKKLRKADKEHYANLKENAKFKAQRAKEDFRFLALFVVEFITALIIAVAIFVYLDPEVEIIKAGFPFNLIGFIAMVAVALYVFHLTRSFRLGSGLQEKAQ